MAEGAAKTSHHDQDRQGVGLTAHAVAAVRAIESSRAPERRLVNDPFAEELAGKIGKDYLSSYSRFGLFLLGSELLRNIFWLFTPLLRGYPELGMLDGLAVRTRIIDDEIRANLRLHNIEQICVLGAGLDARPWRLKLDDLFEESQNPDFIHLPGETEGEKSSLEITTQKRIDYFEYDFPEMFAFKLKVLNRLEAKTDFSYHKVEGDLSLPDWQTHLLKAGFQVQKPTMWILEGFTGYLTEEEFRRLFAVVSNQLSAKGSRCIITFVKPHAARLPVTKNMHKFRPKDPLKLVESFGWVDSKEESFEAAGTRLKREIYPVHSTAGHVFVTAEKQ